MTGNERAQHRAMELLKRHHVTAPPVDVESVATAEGARVRRQGLQDGTSGVLIRDQAGVVTIGVNALHHPNRQRFTIAHELGHFVLHGDQPGVFVDGLMVHFRADRSSESSDPREIEANAFAAGLLMPEHFLRADLRGGTVDPLDDAAVRALALRYEVSQQALTIRLASLGLIAGLGAMPASRRRQG